MTTDLIETLKEIREAIVDLATEIEAIADPVPRDNGLNHRLRGMLEYTRRQYPELQAEVPEDQHTGTLSPLGADSQISKNLDRWGMAVTQAERLIIDSERNSGAGCSIRLGVSHLPETTGHSLAIAVLKKAVNDGFRGVTFDDLGEGFVLQLLPRLDRERLLVESERKRTDERNPSDAADPQPKADNSILIDIDRATLTFRGETYEVSSRQALRWIKVLSDRPGVWISGRELESLDSSLANVRTNDLKSYLPEAVATCIKSQTGAGSRWNPKSV